MLFKVEIEIQIPHTLASEQVAALRMEETEVARKLQTDGKWKHLWRVVGRSANLSIFDVDSTDELHRILSSLPLFPFMDIVITPLCQHPASIT
jgi:muconolactone D-isomerase